MQRWEWGLQMLGQDIWNYIQDKREQEQTSSIPNDVHSETKSSGDKPVFVNNVYNYSNGTQLTRTPLKFGFTSMVKIIILVVVIAFTVQLVVNPEQLISWWHSFLEVVRGI